MTEFNRTHAAIFDELERQGVGNINIVELTRAVLTANEIIAAAARSEPYRRCANGACDD
jgi:hypothetical protein